jgi:biotin carboxyl carrier protein
MQRAQLGLETFVHTAAGQFVFDDSIQRTRASHSDPTAQRTQQISSPLPGTIVKILVAPEESVLAGQTLLLLESMKMEHEIKSTNAGTVKHIHVTETSTIKKGMPHVTVG